MGRTVLIPELLVTTLFRRLPVGIKNKIRAVADGLGPITQTVQAGPAAGYKIVAPLNRRMNFCHGTHEPHVTRAIADYLKPGMTAVDVGAYLGAHALSMRARVGKSGRVYAFEPSQENARLLKKTFRKNKFENSFVEEIALGRSNGVTSLSGPKDSMLRASAKLEQDASTTQMMSLDSWVVERGVKKIDFIKIDIEGGELEALIGMENIVSEFHPAIICEVHAHASISYSPLEIADWFEQSGYAVKSLLKPQDDVKEILKNLAARQSDDSTGAVFIHHGIAVV